MRYLDVVTNELKRSRKLCAIDRPAEHLGAEHLLRGQRSPLSVPTSGRIDYDSMAVKLRVQFPAGVMCETCNDPVAGRLDCALAVLLDTGLRDGRLKVFERLSHRQVMRFDDSNVLCNERQ